MFIKRIAKQKLIKLSKQFSVVAVVGPRQSGKTITDDFFSDILHWQGLSSAKKFFLIYGGDEIQKRSATTVLGWKWINDVFQINH